MIKMMLDTDGDLLVVGNKCLDHDDDLLRVLSVDHNEGYVEVEYLKTVSAWTMRYVTWNFDDLNDRDVSFKKAITEQKQEVSTTPTLSSGTKNDSGKLRFDLVPSDALQEVVEVITYGESKYPSVELDGAKVQNWRVLPDAENRLFAAAQRHLWQHRSGEILDQETKLKHLAHAASSLMFLIAIENEKIEKQTKGNHDTN